MVLAIIDLGEARSPNGLRKIFATFGFVGSRNFIFRENGSPGAFRNTCTTIDTSVGVNIIPGPLVNRFARYNAFHRTNRCATAIAQTETGNNVGHRFLL
jgi:hypothetical protein